MLPIQCRMARAGLGLGVRKLAAAARYRLTRCSGSSAVSEYGSGQLIAFVKFSKLLA